MKTLSKSVVQLKRIRKTDKQAEVNSDFELDDLEID